MRCNIPCMVRDGNVWCSKCLSVHFLFLCCVFVQVALVWQPLYFWERCWSASSWYSLSPPFSTSNAPTDFQVSSTAATRVRSTAQWLTVTRFWCWLWFCNFLFSPPNATLCFCSFSAFIFQPSETVSGFWLFVFFLVVVAYSECRNYKSVFNEVFVRQLFNLCSFPSRLLWSPPRQVRWPHSLL